MSLLADPAPAAPAPNAAPPAGGGDNTPPATPNAPSGQGNPPAAPAGNDPAIASPYYKGFYGEDGKIDKTAWDRLPDHLKPYKDQFSKYDSMDALLIGTANLASLAGKKGLAPLPANAPDHVKAERAALLREINGTPKTPEEYGIKRPDTVPEDQWNGEYVNGVLGVLHKHNASPELVKELVALDTDFAGKSREGMQAKSEAEKAAYAQTQVKELETTWPVAAERTKALQLATRAAMTAGLDPTKDPIFAHAAVVKAFAKFGELVSEDKLVSGADQTGQGGNDQTKALDIINNPDNGEHKAYHDPSHPMHKRAVSMVNTFLERHSKRAGKQ